MPPMMQPMGTEAIYELVYSFIVVAICLTIYFKTKEIYNLTSHKGIKYFRLTFLFFAISYALNFVSRIFFMNLHRFFELTQAEVFLFGTILIITLYLNLIAPLYLIYSIIWKRIKSKLFQRTWFLHVISFLILITTLILQNNLVFLISQIIILILGVIALILNHIEKRKQIKNKKNKKSNLVEIIYPLLLTFWFFGIIDLVIPNFMKLIQYGIYLISIIIFSIIFYKVIKRTH